MSVPSICLMSSQKHVSPTHTHTHNQAHIHAHMHICESIHQHTLVPAVTTNRTNQGNNHSKLVGDDGGRRIENEHELEEMVSNII